jgi:hypothetical protein
MNRDLGIEMRSASTLRPYANNARRHSKRQVRQTADSIRRFGFTNPLLVEDDGEIIAGHGHIEAAKRIGMSEVPTIALRHLSAAERRASVLADNKLALHAGWDVDMLAIELKGLIDFDFDVSLTAFARTFFPNIERCYRGGAIAFACMDWRHLRKMRDACSAMSCLAWTEPATATAIWIRIARLGEMGRVVGGHRSASGSGQAAASISSRTESPAC